jgi:hypothetical protein
MSSSSSGSNRPPSIQDLRAARGARPSFARRFRRRLIAGGVVVLLILFGFFGLPPIVRAQAAKRLSERLGRAVAIEKVRINPLVLSASVEGFSIAEADPAAGEFTGWRRLYVNFDSWSLFTGDIGFQEIALDGFRARVARGADGSLNFGDIVAKLTAPDPSAPPPEPKDPDAKPPTLAVGKLAVTDARLAFSDDSRDRPYSTEVGPVSFGLQDFRTVGDPDSPYQFEAVTSAGERLAWNGSVSADPIASKGELVLANIDIARLSPYYHQLVEGELRSALVDVSGRYTFELRGAAPALTLADGAVVLREVRFGAPGTEADAFALKRLAVTGISADSVSMKSSIAKVAIEGVQVKATRDAQGIDLLRLVTPKLPAKGAAASSAVAATPPAPSAASGAVSSAAPPIVTLGELSLADVRIEAVDLTTPRRAEHRIEDLRLTLRDLDSSDLAKALPLALEVKLPEEGRVAVEGSVAARPLAAKLAIVMERVPFSNASPYVEPFLNIRVAGGAIRSRGEATLRDGVATFAGDFGVAGFRTVDGKLAEDFLKWSDFAITGIKATSSPLAFHADEIRFVEPDASVRVEADGSLNFAHAVAAPKGGPAAPSSKDAGKATAPASVSLPGAKPGASAPAAFPVAVTVGKFAMDRAAFRFEDRSVKPAARGGIADFSGTITGLSSDALGRADVELRGKVDGVAPVSIVGKLNPLGTPAFVDLKVDFKGIDLQPGAGPYIGKYAGRELSRGNLNVAITAKLNDRKIDTDNLIVLDQFFLGAKTDSPDATKLPVGLALALLRDTNGKISLPVPVKGSLDDPQFKIGRVVVQVVVNILTKAATSPFSLLGAAFGGGGDELGWQDFPAGLATMDAAGIKKLETVAKALNARPALSLDIVGAYDPVADLDALRRVQLDQQVRAAAWEVRRLVDPNTPPPEQIEITPELRAGMLAKLYAEAFPPAPGELAPHFVANEGGPPIALPVAPDSETRAEASRKQAVAGQVGRLRRYDTEPPRKGGPSVPKTPVPVAEPAPDAEGGPAAPVVPTITLAEMEAKLAERIQIPDAELQALGESRARVVRGWLLETGKVAGERVFLGPVVAKGTRVSLNLK